MAYPQTLDSWASHSAGGTLTAARVNEYHTAIIELERRMGLDSTNALAAPTGARGLCTRWNESDATLDGSGSFTVFDHRIPALHDAIEGGGSTLRVEGWQLSISAGQGAQPGGRQNRAMALGYNCRGDGLAMDTSDCSFGHVVESHYEVGGERWCEWYTKWGNPARSVEFRNVMAVVRANLATGAFIGARTTFRGRTEVLTEDGVTSVLDVLGTTGAYFDTPIKLKSGRYIYADESDKFIVGYYGPGPYHFFGHADTPTLISGSGVTYQGQLKGPVATPAAAGTNQGNSTALTADNNFVTGGDGNTGVTLMTAVAGMRVLIKNNASAILKVWPASGAAINALGANNSISMAANTSAIFAAASATQWWTCPLLPS